MPLTLLKHCCTRCKNSNKFGFNSLAGVLAIAPRVALSSSVLHATNCFVIVSEGVIKKDFFYCLPYGGNSHWLNCSCFAIATQAAKTSSVLHATNCYDFYIDSFYSKVFVPCGATPIESITIASRPQPTRCHLAAFRVTIAL